MMGPVLEISAARLRANIDAVRERISPSALLFAMKDDAYGHGLEWAAATAAGVGVEWFGSYDVESALRIRGTVGPHPRIFAWVTSEDEEIAQAIAADVDLGVGTREYLARVIAGAERAGAPARVHLKIDTGLHRNGIRPEDWNDAVSDARAAETAGLIRIVGVWSHISEASDEDDDASKDVFVSAADEVRAAGATPEHLHLTASAAAWWRPELRGNLSRIGAFCYGIRSADGPELDGIAPIASLRAPVTEVAADLVRIGIGSLDGYPSSLVGAPAGSPAGATSVREIALTSMTLDGWDGAAIGDTVTLFGPGLRGEPSATDLAERIDTVGEEILTRLSPRIARVYVD
ncbi:alanine racemase [Microbacterium sp. NPDC055903]